LLQPSLHRATGGARAENQAGLTPRELDVLRLLVAGKTDREIAEELFISPRTAQGHVGSIYAKLGVGSRAAAVTASFQLGLVGESTTSG
jgi:DNA-binding CsgD family transcriptional regulator